MEKVEVADLLRELGEHIKIVGINHQLNIAYFSLKSNKQLFCISAVRDHIVIQTTLTLSSINTKYLIYLNLSEADTVSIEELLREITHEIKFDPGNLRYFLQSDARFQGIELPWIELHYYKIGEDIRFNRYIGFCWPSEFLPRELIGDLGNVCDFKVLVSEDTVNDESDSVKLICEPINANLNSVLEFAMNSSKYLYEVEGNTLTCDVRWSQLSI